MSAPGEHTRPLAELRAADAAHFGGKSASLGELLAAGIPAPPGFALSSAAFRACLEEAGVEDQVQARLARLDPEDLVALRAAADELAKAVRAAPIPSAVRDEIAARYEELGEPPVAVRSSALGEDSAEATFAGQQETLLWVRGADAVCAAVRDCWASLYGAEALAYRARLPDAGAPAMGVTIQEMVEAAVSGVLFTCNPLSGDPSTVAVNASWGLGLAVVGGEVTPDEYRVSKVTGEVIQRTIGPKAVEYVPGEAGTRRVEVEPERRERACLDDDALAQLLELARRVERHFGSHQDVEWAIDASGSLFVLQSRPVTTAPERAEPAGEPRSAMSMVMSTFGAPPRKSS